MSKIFTITEGLENMGALRTGGQGSVYKGKRIGEIITAVKILPTPIHSDNPEDKNLKIFKSEVEKLKKVNEVPNPHVVKILNSGLTESGSFPFIEMEFIEGPDLEDLLKPPHHPVFTIRETIKLAEQLASAIAHCHKVGVKHGDIKSNNIKFNNATGNYILFDFGLAIMSDEQRRSSIRHAGAVEFMAPEQHDGEMFFQTDVYSFGIVLYELLAGIVPFPQTNNGESSRNAVMLSHLEKQVPDLIGLRKAHLPDTWSTDVQNKELNVPAWLTAMISRCLQKLPEKRFEHGMALQDFILQHVSENSPAMSEPPQIVDIAQPQTDSDAVQVSKPIFYVLLLALVTLSCFTAYSLYMNDLNEQRLSARIDSLNSLEGIDTPEGDDQISDTSIADIKPIISDTAILAENTDADSLQKEFDRQTGAIEKKPEQSPPPQPEPKPAVEKTKGAVLTSEGKRYQAPQGITYFYNEPDSAKPRRAVLGLWSNAKFNVVDEQHGFIYVTHTNNDGEVTKGWIKISDLKRLP